MSDFVQSIERASVRAVMAATGQSFTVQPIQKWCNDRDICPQKIVHPVYGKVNEWPADAWWQVYMISLPKLFGAQT